MGGLRRGDLLRGYEGKKKAGPGWEERKPHKGSEIRPV